MISHTMKAMDNKGNRRFESIEADGMIHLRRLPELNISLESEIEKEPSFLGS